MLDRWPEFYDGKIISMVNLTREQAGDWWEVEALYDLCFAPGRTALSSYRLRENIPAISELCFIARDEQGILAGAIRNWPVCVGDKPAILLGPVAVHQTRQGEGVGGLLMRASLQTAADLGWDRVLLVGDLPYYQRFGFFPLANVDMPPPTNPDRVLGYELTEGAWAGVTGQVVQFGNCNSG